MKRNLIALLSFLCFLFVIPCTAMAQDGEKEVYEGENFKIEPPAKWIQVSGNLSEKELSKLPENVREHYNVRNTDVLFMNISSLDEPTQGFKDSLNIVTVSDPIPLTDDLVKELTDVLKQQYNSIFENFEAVSMKVIKLGSKEVFEVQGKYTILNYSIIMRQIFMPLSGSSLVLTCTYEASHEEEVSKLCENSIKSLVLK